MSDDLKDLFPEIKTVQAQGEDIKIAPFFFGQFPKVMGLLKQITEKITGLNLVAVESDGKKINFKVQTDWITYIPEVMESAGEPWIDLLGLASGKPRAWFDKLPFDEGFALSKALIEVNADFFARKVLPLLPKAEEKAVQEASTDGEASLQSLEATDTQQATSIV